MYFISVKIQQFKNLASIVQDWLGPELMFSKNVEWDFKNSSNYVNFLMRKRIFQN